MQDQFCNLRAAELFCPRCCVARPVRERLLLVLPRSELHEYRCATCGESCGLREVSAAPIAAARPASALRRRAAHPPHRKPKGYLK